MANGCLQVKNTDEKWIQSHSFKKAMVTKKFVNFAKSEIGDGVGIDVTLGYRRFHSNGKLNDMNSISTFIPIDNAKLFRNWLVKQVPFTKQELVELMTETTKSQKSVLRTVQRGCVVYNNNKYADCALAEYEGQPLPVQYDANKDVVRVRISGRPIDMVIVCKRVEKEVCGE